MLYMFVRLAIHNHRLLFLNTEMAVLHTLPFNLVSSLYKFSFFSLSIYILFPAPCESRKLLKEHVFAGAH